MELSGEVIQRYLERRRQDFDKCLASLVQNDFLQMEIIGHQLKGSGAMFGFPDLSLIGKNLEKAARSRDLKQLQMTLVHFFSWIELEH